MDDLSVEQTVTFVGQMSFPNFRSFTDESDDGSGAVTESDPLAVHQSKGKSASKAKNYNGPRCSVLHCTNKKDDAHPDLSFHRFPKSPSLQRIWAKRTRPPLTSNLQNRFVCAIHFDPKVLRVRGSFKDSKRRLKPNAIPTLHLPPENGDDDKDIQSDHEPSSELDLPSEPEIDVDDADLSRPLKMVRNYKRLFTSHRKGKYFKPYRSYTEDVLREALGLVKNGSLSVIEASERYSVPVPTMYRLLKKKNVTAFTPLGHPTLFTPEEEESFVHHLNAVADRGYPFNLFDLRIMAKGYLDKKGLDMPFMTDNMPGYDWAKEFLKRHRHQLSERFGSCINRKRAQIEIDPARDIEMVELSSEEDDVEAVDAEEAGVQALTSADALAAISALQIPSRPTGGPHKPKVISKKPRKSFGAERSPTKPINLNGSVDGSYVSDEEGDDDDIALVPSEELDFLELQDPLESAYIPAVWKTLPERSRRATLRAYFSRIASYLPIRFPRNSKMAILESAAQYLKEVTRSNAALAVENELLLQTHFKLRKAKRKIDKKVRMVKC